MSDTADNTTNNDNNTVSTTPATSCCNRPIRTHSSKPHEPSHGQQQRLLIAMKGHPGSGKSTLARALARTLGCPLVDKDDIRDCTMPLDGSTAGGHGGDGSTTKQLKLLPSSLLNDLSYEVMWRVADTQLAAGLSVVVDCPLARPALLARARAAAARHAAELVLVECRCGDAEQWRRRVESRRASAAAAASQQQQMFAWHKPASWADLERLLDGYAGCWDYDTGGVRKLVLDTAAVAPAEALHRTLRWLHLPEPEEESTCTALPASVPPSLDASCCSPPTS